MKDKMNLNKKIPTTKIARRENFAGSSIRAGLMLAASLFLLIAGCKKDSSTTGPNPIVIPVQTTVQAAVNLRSDAGFVILAGSLVSNIPTSAIVGNIGLSPAARSFITGFGLTEVTGTIYASDDVSPVGVPAMLTAAKGDLTTAYNDAAGRTATDIVQLAGNIGGLTLTPGLYKSSGSLQISSGDLTFDAKGNADAVFIIQIASTLNTTSGRQVILSGSAKAANIFWQVGTSATLGTTSVFKGNILADQSISLNTGAVVEGRLLARIAEVTLASNVVVIPLP
jgi:Ice-binding-like